MLRSAALTVVALSLCACGEPDYVPKSTTLSGSVQGVTIENPQALFSSQEGTLGVNDATIFISEVGECSELSKSSATTDSRSAVHDAQGNRLPSLVLVLGGQTAFKSNRREYGKGLVASWDPGAPAECESLTRGPTMSDGGTCPAVVKADGGTAWIYESDSTKSDDKPRAVARYDLNFQGERLTGTVVAKPCQSVNGGCSTTGGGVMVGGILLAMLAIARGRGRRSGI